MPATSVCTACLATDIRMFSLSTGGLLQAYRLISGRQVDMSTQQWLCWECAAHVHKFNTFRQKCERAYLLLCDHHSRAYTKAEKFVSEFDRKRHLLSSVYSLSVTENYSYAGSTLENDAALGEFSIDSHERISIKEETEGEIKNFIELKKEPVIEMNLGNENVNSDEESRDNCFDVKIEPTVIIGLANDCDIKIGKTIDIKPECFGAMEVLITQEQALDVYRLRKFSSKYKKAKYKCDLCYQHFNKLQAYSKHMLKHDPCLGPFECDACKMRFSSRRVIQAHIYRLHTRQYLCNICSKVSHTRDIAKQHFMFHERLGPLMKQQKLGVKVSKKKLPARKFCFTEVLQTQEKMMEAVRERENTEAYKGSRFKCTLCYKGFLAIKTYSNHMLLHDKVSGEHECDICKLRFRSRIFVYKHISMNHMRKYICKRCSYVCYNRTAAREHYSWHEGVVFTCHVCDATFKKKTSHLSHVRIKHPSDHVCAACGESFINVRGLRRHTRLMHELRQHVQPETTDDGPYCPECKVHFATTQAWTRHMLISSNHDYLKSSIINGCRNCGETFDTPFELKRHRREQHAAHGATVRKPAPLSCAECRAVMAGRGEYRAHFAQLHPGVPLPAALDTRFYICEICGQECKSNANLQIHIDRHLGRRDHKCELCPKTFTCRMGLQCHVASHSDARPYLCAVCGKGFKLPTARDRHKRLHTGERPYECHTCGKTFASSTGRNLHTRNVHKLDPPHLPGGRPLSDYTRTRPAQFSSVTST